MRGGPKIIFPCLLNSNQSLSSSKWAYKTNMNYLRGKRSLTGNRRQLNKIVFSLFFPASFTI